MATKKTNKTSHVMNLLTNGAPAENSENAAAPADTASSPEASAAGGQEKKSDVQSHTVTPKKVTVVDEGSRNDRLSQEILNKLSEELEEEQEMENQEQVQTAGAPEIQDAAAQTAQAPEVQDTAAQTAQAPEIQNTAAQAAEPAQAAQAEEPVMQAAPEPAPATQEPAQAQAAAPAAQESAPAEEAQAEAASEPVPAAQEPAQAQAAAPAEETAPKPAPEPKEETPIQLSGKTAHHAILPKSDVEGNLINGEYRFVNIMEHLMLRQDISSYLDQYNVCKCPRCMADVCALALTGLPPKYVVTNKDSLSPLISYYENRNKITMLTALIKACNKVRENPRHKRS